MKSVNEMSAMEVQAMMKKMEEFEAKAAKQRERAKAYRERNKEKTAMWSERARVRSLLLAKKAKEAGLTVTDEEIDEYLASRG